MFVQRKEVGGGHNALRVTVNYHMQMVSGSDTGSTYAGGAGGVSLWVEQVGCHCVV